MGMKRWKAALVFVLMMAILASCQGRDGQNSLQSNNNDVDGSMKNAESLPEVPIDYGLFCGDICQEALTLQAPRDSIVGKVGVIVSGIFPYGLGTKRMAEEAAKKYFKNMSIVIGNGKSDPVLQSKLVDDFISQKVDVIVIDLVEKDAVNPALLRATAANIPIITIDRWTPVDVLTLIKAEDVEVGRKAGQQVVNLLEGKGNVVELKGTEASTTTLDRREGILEAFTGYPDIKIIESINADFVEEKGYRMVKDILNRHPNGEINALVSHADVMTMGAIKAIKEAGLEDEIVVVSVDAQETALEAIEAGEIDATVAYPIVMPMGILAAAKTLAGEPMPDFIELDAPLITKENVATYKGKTGY